MAIAEKLQQKLEKKKEALAEKSKSAEKGGEAQIDSGEWLLLFLASGFIDIIFIILTIIGLIPLVGQVIFAVVDPVLNLLFTYLFFFYLISKRMTAYWSLAFGGGLAGMIPVLDWISWTLAILTLYLVIKAKETALAKIPLAGEAIEKVAKTASKVK